MQTTIKLYGQSVSIETYDRPLINHIGVFLKRYYTHIPLKANPNVEVKEKQYVSKIKNKPIWFMHINQFNHFRFYLRDISFEMKEVEVIDKRDYKEVTGEYTIRPTWQLREKQVGVNEFLLDNPTGSKLLPLATGSGKAQPLDCLIKAPGGWYKMDNIRVGNIITAQDGTPCKVTGVFPQGITDVYEIEFEDGRKTKASGDHLWNIHCTDFAPSKLGTTLTTREVLTILERDDCVVSISLHEQEQSNDQETYKHIRDVVNIFLKEKKFNPFLKVLNASYTKRKQLFDELVTRRTLKIDDNCVVFSSYNMGHLKNVQLLARSLGYLAEIRPSDYTNYLTVTLSENFVGLKLKIKSIKRVEDEETQCISIDHPDQLYITDNYIVTHNTLCGLYSVGKLNKRLGIIVLSQFVEKWASDIVTIHDAKTKDVMFVQGSAGIRGVAALAMSNELESKYFLFSSRTMLDFVSAYEEDPEVCVEQYGISPIELFPLLGIGILLIDETHMAFHAMYKTVLHTNVKYQIGLSATLIADSEVLARAHMVMYPKAVTYHDNMQKQYMDIYAVSYGMNPVYLQKKVIKTTHNGSKFYSHTSFEKSVEKNSKIFKDYYGIIRCLMDDYYFEGRDPRDSLVIYVSTISMATKIKDLLKAEFPDKDIVRYCEDDAYDPMIKAEIVVTTPQSLSTGIDKPNLRVVIQTVSISSEVTNVQSAGRLRELPDRDVKFVYIYCNNIPKQVEYHKKKEQMFLTRAKSFCHHRARRSIS